MNHQPQSTSQLLELVTWLYSRCLNGGYGFKSANELAQHYKLRYPNESQCIAMLIRYESTKAGTNGFIAGLGGVLTLPIALPVNAVSVLFLQMRLVMAIAIIKGHDLNQNSIKALVYLSLCGQSIKSILKEHCGLLLSRSLSALLNVATQQIAINIAKQQGVKNALKLCRYMPLIGGVVGATCDSVVTYQIGYLAERQFRLCVF